jgi:hypothetical protein
MKHFKTNSSPNSLNIQDGQLYSLNNRPQPRCFDLRAPSSRRAPQSTTEFDEFAIGLIAEGYPFLNLNAIPSGTVGTVDLVFERPSAFPSTPAFFNGTYLDFNLKEPAPYAMYFEDMGDNHGISVPVTAIYAPG